MLGSLGRVKTPEDDGKRKERKKGSPFFLFPSSTAGLQFLILEYPTGTSTEERACLFQTIQQLVLITN